MAVPKDAPDERPLHDGVMDPETWEKIAAALRLSPRQSEVAKGILDDASESVLAARLGVSTHTVHSHLERLYRKLQVNSRVQLVVRVMAELQHLRGDAPSKHESAEG